MAGFWVMDGDGLFQLCGLFLFSVQISGCMPIFNRIESLILGGPPFFVA